MSDNVKILLIYITFVLVPVLIEVLLTSMPDGYIAVCIFFLMLCGAYFYDKQANSFPFQDTKRYYYLSGGCQNFCSSPVCIDIKKSYLNYDFKKQKFKRDNKRAKNILTYALAEADITLQITSTVIISSSVPVKLTPNDINALISRQFDTVNMIDLKVLNMNDSLIEELKANVTKLILPREENFYFTYNNI